MTRMAGRGISREEFYQRHPEQRPTAEDIAAVAGWQNEEDEFNIAYRAATGQGLSHEEATRAAQREVYGKVRSEMPLPPNRGNLRTAQMPLSEPLPERGPQAYRQDELEEIAARNAIAAMLRRQGRTDEQISELLSVRDAVGAEQPTNQLPAVQAAVESAKNSRVPLGPSGRRMALRYGAPTLGALLGLYGLAALTGGSEPQREYSEPR